jgi:hypothetical protein
VLTRFWRGHTRVFGIPVQSSGGPLGAKKAALVYSRHGQLWFGVADELLRNRAGMNVLALLTAITSVLDSGTVEVLDTLYEKLQVPAHSIPSLSQLQHVRFSCLPLTRKMDFKDRIVKMHQWLVHNFSLKKKPIELYDELP